MYPDQLYDLALAFRKTKLWKWLYDSELFAVSLSNGQTGYCCVMGCLGEHIALAVYLGEQGLASIRSYGKARGITFRGANAFPQFIKYLPARYPWPVQETADVQLLCEALTAALEVSEKLAVASKDSLGFTDGPTHDRAIPLLTPEGQGFDWGVCQFPSRRPANYPEPMLRDELLTERLKKQKKRAGVWVCDVVMFPQPAVVEEDNAVPVFPYMLLAADMETGLVIPTEAVLVYEEGAAELLSAIGNQMLENGIPTEIHVVNDRTRALLKNLAATLAIRLVQQQEIEHLDSLEDELLDYCDEQTPDTVAEAADCFSEMLLSLDDDVLLSMPKDLQKQLRSMERQGLLAKDVAIRIRDLF